MAMALDEAHHRLFVGCRDGQIVVLNTANGQEIAALPIAAGVDDVAYDRATKRIYAACDGAVDVYEQKDADHYKMLGKIASGQLGRTARLVPELNRYFVAVPPHGPTGAEILVYQVQ